jgi:Uma2 family endonuclease
MATSAQQVMTTDEFLRVYGDQSGVELVEGQLVRVPMPGARHGKVCVTATILLGNFVLSNRLGRMMSNDTFIRTRTNPDGCRGADLIFLSNATLPADQPVPVGALTPPVELVVEVRSPSNSVLDMTNKASEYLDAGVKLVLVLDPELESAAVYRADEYPQRFHNGDELTLPEVLPGFSVPVKRFFD